jgi:hypothetical protein
MRRHDSDAPRRQASAAYASKRLDPAIAGSFLFCQVTIGRSKLDRIIFLPEGRPPGGAKRPGSSRADVLPHALRIPLARIAAERGAMLIIALLRSGLTGPRKWLRRQALRLRLTKSVIRPNLLCCTMQPMRL